MDLINEQLKEKLKRYTATTAAIPPEVQDLIKALDSEYEDLEESHKHMQQVVAEQSAEIALLKSRLSDEPHRADFYEKLQEAFFTVDAENQRCTFMSPAAEKVYGHTAEEFMQDFDLWHKVILEEDRERINSNIPILFSGRSIVQEYRTRRQDGSIRWLESKLEPTLNADGKLVRIHGVTADITARKEAEIALRESELKFRSLILNSSDAITVINENFEVVFGSESMHRITGFLPEEVKGKTFADFVHPDDAALAEAYFEELRNNPGVTKKLTFRTQKKDGSYYWCERVGVNLLHNPAVRGIVSNYRDISDRKVVEERLQASNDSLKKINMELDRFVYSVSHDLRAPLSSILGVIGLMELKTVDNELLHDMSLLKKSAQKLDGFILDILNYSKNARTEVSKQPVHFKPLLDEIISHLKFMDSGSPAIDIRIQIDDDTPFYSDKNRLNMILNNLLSNAIRYKDPASAAPFADISIHTSADCARIVVSDNGIGIAPGDQPRVFEMFSRLSKSSVGSGLGLYIVKEAVQNLGGTIALQSDLGKGSAFTIILPNPKDPELH